MRLSLCLFLSALFVTTVSFAQEPTGTSHSMQQMIEARKTHYPDLPLQVISKQGSQHTFLSPDGRYVITGTIQDLWDGTYQTGTVVEAFPAVPSYVNAKDYFIELGSGEELVEVFVSYSCVNCLESIQAMFENDHLNKYTFRVLPVANNPTDAVMLNQLYCRSDKLAFFKKVYLNRDVRDAIKQGCPDIQTSMNNALAKALNIRALPLVHKRNESLTIIGNATDYL